MSLRLRQTVAGRPNVSARQSTGVLTISGKGYIVYPSSDNVVLVDTALQLMVTWQFWKALPYFRSEASSSLAAPANVEGVCCSPENLVIAWCGVHIVIWHSVPVSKSSTRTKWEVHSTLLASASVTCMDCRKGILAVGTANGIELWRMDPKAEVVVWDRLWDRSYPAPSSVQVAPFATHIAWHTEGQKSVYIHTLNSKSQVMGIAQELRHPREVEWIAWRKSRSDNGDAHLYTITTNSVIRIYSPVLDDPSWFQLLSSLDHRVFERTIKTQSSAGKNTSTPSGKFWVLDAAKLHLAVKHELERIKDGTTKVAAEVEKILSGLDGEESDMIAWMGTDGSMALRSIVNMDRKPPTLLKNLPLAMGKAPFAAQQSVFPAGASLLNSDTGLHLVFAPSNSTPLTSITITLVQLLSFATKDSPGDASLFETETPVQFSQTIDRFVRTPNGRGLLAIGVNGEVGAWEKRRLGSPTKSTAQVDPLIGKGKWKMSRPPIQSAIYAKGRALVFCTVDEEGRPSVHLSHLDDTMGSPTEPIALPHFSPEDSDKVAMLMGVSDIDDGMSGRGRRTQRALIIAATESGETWIWRINSRFVSSESTATDHTPDISLLSHCKLPVHTADGSVAPHLILPVDPMGWHQSVINWESDTPAQDLILTISAEGTMEFWQPRLGQHLIGRDTPETYANGDVACNGEAKSNAHTPWIRTGVVNTGKRNILSARCSSRKKTVLVCELLDGSHEMTIWDSNISTFSTGLELTHIFPKGEIIQDLDWTTTSDLQSVLAVGFRHSVVLVCEQRMSYIDTSPGWGPFLTINMERYTSVPINDSIWLAGGSLAVAAGNQVYLFSRYIDQEQQTPSPAASARSLSLDPTDPEDMFQLIAHQNGPLYDYHPTLLTQCLLWNKVDLVKTILKALIKSLQHGEDVGERYLKYARLEASEFYGERKLVQNVKASAQKYNSLFDVEMSAAQDEDDAFSSRSVEDLVERLDGPVGLPLSHNEKSALATVAQATLEIERQRRSLDTCGLRYLISLRMFVNQNRRAGMSGTTTPGSGAATPGSGHSRHHRTRLAFRNIVWALHSDSQDILLSAATECCHDGKMLWQDAKRLGVFLWLKSSDTLKAQLEIVARNRFMQDEDRDPTSCSLIFFALGKKKIVHGLWRQAPGHKEQQLMLKFLANDFELPRWKSAATKNAYALLAKQRFEYAAAFFMLAGSPKDALNVCLRQMDDWQMAVALARAVEGGTEGPLLKWVVGDFVLPIAFAGGHRWLASWCFWILGRRDLAVRVSITPMSEVAEAYSPGHSMPVGDPENDDPSLLLLFQHLKSRSLQTAKGTLEISSKLEFDFVLHNARVFFRMGCHPLALDLLRSWSFERPIFVPSKKLRSESAIMGISSSIPIRPALTVISPSYSRTRRPSFMLASGHGRRESMLMDMDVLNESGSSTRVPSPSGDVANAISIDAKTKEIEAKDTVKEEPVVPPKMGNLMKELKQDVTQGAMEFDMNSFF